MGIWRNIGKIVSLSGEIIIQEIEWYLYGIHKKKKHESHDSPSSELNNIQHSGVGSNYEPLSEQEESIERSKVMLHQYEYEQVEWSENPYPGVGSNYEPLSEEMK